MIYFQTSISNKTCITNITGDRIYPLFEVQYNIVAFPSSTGKYGIETSLLLKSTVI